MKEYKIKITYLNADDVQPELIELSTDNIDWSMEQYQRNRNPFSWEIVE
mgnify:FL=1|jgi:hypothetical protein